MHRFWPEVERSLPQLWRTVCGYEANPADQQELLQEVLLAIWECLPRLRDPERLLPFVLGIAHNVGCSHVRSAVRRPQALPLDEHLGLAAPDQEGDPGRSRWLFEAIRALPIGLRQPLMLQLEGFDYDEIAELLGISADNVGVRLHRARARLKQRSLQETADDA
jgi:RNA polymerase sigma factor (sigma-70 family)